jgi:hypothetical protein
MSSSGVEEFVQPIIARVRVAAIFRIIRIELCLL